MLLTQAKTLRDVGRYTDALDLLYHERKLRALMNDLLGQVWSLLEEARIRKFRREFKSAAAASLPAITWLAPTCMSIARESQTKEAISTAAIGNWTKRRLITNLRRRQRTRQVSSG
jgi:hypothetical protein